MKYKRKLVIVAVAGLLGISAYAQAPASSSTPPPATAEDIPVHLPGGSEAGPTLSSQRGIGPIRSGESLVRISPYLGIQGTYNTGLGGFEKDADGNLVNQDAYGVNLNFGIMGTRPFRTSLLTVAYRGNYQQYTRGLGLNGSNHRGEVQVAHMFSRRLTLNSMNSFGYMNNAFFSNFGFAGQNRYESGVPINDFFNVPTFFANTTQVLSYQKSARLSFSGGGGGSVQWRDAEGLAGVKTVNALGTMAYRISRRQTIAVNYQFSQFFFTNQYGGSNVHTISGEYAVQLGPRTEFALLFGGARVESQALLVVQLDPLLAELLGTSTGIQADYRKNYLPTYGASLGHSLRSWSFGVEASRSVNAGNGLVLTNMTTTYGGNIRYTGGRRWSAGLNAGYSSMKGLKANTGNFEGYNANLGFNLQISRGFSWTASAGWRKFGAGSSALSANFRDRDQYQLSTGFFWSPSPMPLPFF